LPVTPVAAAALSGPALAGGFGDAITIPAPLPVYPETGSLGSLGGLGGTAAILGPVALLAKRISSPDDDEQVSHAT